MDGNFGRIVKATFTPSKYDKNGNLIISENSVVICYDTNENIDYCSRIDFVTYETSVQQVYTKRLAQKLCMIDIWNLGPELSQMFDIFNASEGFSDVFNRNLWSVKLEVGYANKTIETVFEGGVTSYYVERRQTTKDVDYIYHFVCKYPIQKVFLGNNKAVSGVDYSKKENMEGLPSENSVTTPHDILTQRLEKEERFSLENLGKTALSIFSGGLINIKTDRIFYSTETLEKKFKETKVKPDTFKETNNFATDINNICKKYQARCEYTKSIGITILPLETSKESKQEVKSKKAPLVIKNFQNLIKPPEVQASTIAFTLLLEPSIHPVDLIRMEIDEDFSSKYIPSFSPKINQSAEISSFWGSSSLGIIYKNSLSKFGNIFENNYLIQSVQHTGSTHDATWETKIQCIANIIGA